MSDGLMLAIEDVVIDAAGELNLGASRELLAVAEPLAATGCSLVLDLADDMMIATPARSARWSGWTDAAGGDVRVARLLPQVEATIAVTMLHGVPDICADVPDSRRESEAP